MEWTGLNQLREKYLEFFERKGHIRLKSFPLTPQNDNSLLLINSGMAPMKKYFTGEVTPPGPRVTTCQKCIRTPDLERVGITARHGTFFEMLGNFSFGDYFKEEAIPWAWEFLTETLEIPAQLLWPSVYEEDDEAYALWRDVIGVPEERIVKLGKADNFWEHGTGPCGPCSEIYFDRGEKYGCGSPDCKPGCDCDRYMEIWNNVFSQFNNMGDGTYTELEHKNIDTGMGLERLACVMQGVDNMFEVDTIRNILDKVCEISGKKYGVDGKTDISIRAITDHARASTFMISDGITPSNEGRGYVLRRIIRRAIRHGKLIGIDRPFFMEICDVVINENKAGYPELEEKKEIITQFIVNEEKSFNKTVNLGLAMLSELAANNSVISGEAAFKLYDTYGFPLDLTIDILAEKGLVVDVNRFKELMDEQRKKAKDAREASNSESWKSDGITFENISATEFVGYTRKSAETTVLDIVSEGEHVGVLSKGAQAVIVLGTTPFYAESGGQVGDKGKIITDTAKFKVTSTTKNHNGIYLHKGVMEEGELKIDQAVTAAICSCSRDAIQRNHTSAHLLQAALRKVLGTHVEQAGQLVNKDRMRFDFTHFSALTDGELKAVEKEVNNAIMSAIDLEINEMPIEEAKKMGAMALFGEKYGDLVRVVKCGDVSIELCGGCHVKNTSNIGLFRIISESSVAAGVRRIEAVTGTKVLELLDSREDTIKKTAAILKTTVAPEDIIERAKTLVTDLKDAERKLEQMESQRAAGQISELVAKAVNVGDVRVVTGEIKAESSDGLRSACDKARDMGADIVALLALVSDDKSSVTLCAVCGKDAVAKGAHAGNIIRAVTAKLGGKGGGRPDSAMGGGKDVAGLNEVLASVPSIIEGQLK